MPHKFKKLTLQYAYLKLEKEEVDEACFSVEKEMKTYIKKHYPEHYEAFCAGAPPPQQKSIPENPDTEEEEVEDIKPSEPKNKDLKKLYRRIAEKTHPDKVGDNSHADLFSQSAKAYSNNDIGTLLEIAGNLNIELSEISKESVLLLKNNIKILSEEIDNKKKTTGWAWYNASQAEEKEKIVLAILRFKGMIT